MVRSQTRAPEATITVAPEPEPISAGIFAAVFGNLFKPEPPPAPEPVKEESIPVVTPEWLAPPEVHVTVQVPRRLLYAILAVQAVILCLQVAHLVSP